MANREDEYKKLRAYLSKRIRGKNTDAILRSVASGPVHLINNIEAVNNSLYVVTAQGKYLDGRLGDKGVVRPANVGLSDEVFREIGIEVTTRKQVRDQVHQLLRILYGETYTRTTSPATELENYELKEGDDLIISFDGGEAIKLVFTADQFQNIASATARESADAITKSLRKLGASGAALVQEDSGSNKVVLISTTDGPSSTVQVLGGSAQNVFKFAQIRPTGNESSTVWRFEQVDGGNIRATWVGGANPNLGKVKVGDYANIFGPTFDPNNRGTFTILESKDGPVNEAYVEYSNPSGVEETKTQGEDEAFLFFNPKLSVLTSQQRYAAVFQTSPRTLEVYLPATTKIVRRNRAGAAHIYESGPSLEGQVGPYLYDPTGNFTLGSEVAVTTEELNTNSDSILFVNDVSNFPDDFGDLIIGLGTSHQEGPVPYIAKSSDTALRVNPSYTFKNNHPIGTEVSLLQSKTAAEPSKNGEDFPFYLTDSVAGRIYAEQLIRDITATGIVVIFYILYPNDEGLGKWRDEENSEKYYIWGEEDDLIG